MKNFLKGLGAIIVLLGVLLLMVYYFGFQTNVLLAASGITMLVGLLTHIFLNKHLSK